MEAVDEVDQDVGETPSRVEGRSVQTGSYLLELSLDWIVLRASENIHQLLGKSHVTLIEEPLGHFVHSQALHDLRNLFSRLSGTTGIARAYAVRLTDENELVDVAFQLSEGRVLLEAVPSTGSFGECFGTVGGLIAGLSDSSEGALLEGGARRMRALTGFDRVTLICGDQTAESSRGSFAGRINPVDVPILISDTQAADIGLFPRGLEQTSVHDALMRSPLEPNRQKLHEHGVRAVLRVPFEACGMMCEFYCESRAPWRPSFELHAAAELFAQLFALKFELERARSSG